MHSGATICRFVLTFGLLIGCQRASADDDRSLQIEQSLTWFHPKVERGWYVTRERHGTLALCYRQAGAKEVRCLLYRAAGSAWREVQLNEPVALVFEQVAGPGPRRPFRPAADGDLRRRLESLLDRLAEVGDKVKSPYFVAVSPPGATDGPRVVAACSRFDGEGRVHVSGSAEPAAFWCETALLTRDATRTDAQERLARLPASQAHISLGNRAMVCQSAEPAPQVSAYFARGWSGVAELLGATAGAPVVRQGDRLVFHAAEARRVLDVGPQTLPEIGKALAHEPGSGEPLRQDPVVWLLSP